MKRRFALRLFVVFVVALVGLEFGLRWLAFGDSALARRVGASFRDPSLFASPECGTEWYRVRAAMAKRELAEYPAPGADPLLGWRSAEISGGDYSHVKQGEVAARRPVLFYGDSFTQCVERAGNCWETLLADSALAQEFALLNYGVGGYGFDQIYLLARETLSDWPEARPLVLVGLLVDDDLDRCALRLRSWPKPRFAPQGDGTFLLELPPGPSAADVVREEGSGIGSALWSFLLHNAGVPDEWRRRLLDREGEEAQVRAITRHLLDEFAALFSERSAEACFVLFHGPELTRDGAAHNWRDTFLRAELDARGLAYIDVGATLREAAGERSTDDYFYLEGAGLNHLSTEGNSAAFGAMAAWIERYSLAATSIKRK